MAKLIANKKKIISTNKEMAEALRAKVTTNSFAESGGQKVKEKEEESFNPDEKKLLKTFEDMADNIKKNAPATRIN